MNFKHGKRHTRIYNIWRTMRQRCYNSNSKNYKKYGARGITVCEEWNKSFEAFYEWAVKNGYAENLTLERMNVNGNYEPSNCCWATYKAQANNKRNSRYITCDNETHTLGEWADITGIKKGTIWARLENGWNVTRALTEKPVVRKKQYSFN